MGITTSTLLKKSGRIEEEWKSKGISENYNEHTVKEIRKIEGEWNRRELVGITTSTLLKI